MKEIEVKILDIDVTKVTAKLQNAKKVLDATVKGVYLYNSQLNQKIRIRTMGEKTFITHKSKMQSDTVKMCDEVEFEVASFDESIKLFSALGFETVSSFEKHRISYEYKESHVDIDTFTDEFAFVPTFLEIEAHSYEKIVEIASDLGYSESDLKPWNGAQVIEYYEKSKSN